jgi:hypothetical protein
MTPSTILGQTDHPKLNGMDPETTKMDALMGL